MITLWIIFLYCYEYQSNKIHIRLYEGIMMYYKIIIIIHSNPSSIVEKILLVMHHPHPIPHHQPSAGHIAACRASRRTGAAQRPGGSPQVNQGWSRVRAGEWWTHGWLMIDEMVAEWLMRGLMIENDGADEWLMKCWWRVEVYWRTCDFSTVSWWWINGSRQLMMVNKGAPWIPMSNNDSGGSPTWNLGTAV